MKLISSALITILMLATTDVAAQEEDSNYVDIPTDLKAGLSLLEVAERAQGHSGDYYDSADGNDTDADGDLSAYEAVGDILAFSDASGSDPAAKDVVKVVVAVVDAWSRCDDTFGAVKRGVESMPGRAAEIAAAIGTKRDCNCAAGGIWPQQRVEERIRVDFRHAFIDVPRACSCSQAAMYGAVAGLPEQAEFEAAGDDEEERARITSVVVEKANEIMERTNAAQNRNSWDCGCTDVNLAATMRGIEDNDLREGTWEGLAQKYADEAGDSGLVVDAFGTVGMHPVSAWGSESINSDQHTLRRQSSVYRGDPLILDPFDPALEWVTHTDNNAAGLQAHSYSSDSIPTDVFMSEYIEGWNEEAMAQPEADRDPNDRNRVLELYNGSDEDIDLGSDQYFLEIYGSGAEPVPAPPPVLRKNTITLESGVTFDLDKWDIRSEASETLQSIARVINRADIFSEILIEGHTCDIATDEYNQRLSERRARSVADFLRGAGLNVQAIRTEGHGESTPRLPNINEENRSQNRRVEITFVTRGDREIQSVVRDDNGRRYHEYSWEGEGGTAEAVASTAIPLMFGDEHFVEGEMSPREVIGLNGQIEAGGTFIIAYDGSDEGITDLADVVTGQLDFLPTDTLVLRRFGGDMAMACRAQSYAFLFNYPPHIIPIPEPLRPLPDPICSSPTNCDGSEQASPN